MTWCRVTTPCSVTAILVAALFACSGEPTKPPAIPSQPPTLDLTPLPPEGVLLSWSAVAGEVSVYELEVSEAGGPWQSVGRFTGPTLTAPHQGLRPGRTYTCRVRACNTAGCSPWRSAEFTLRAPPLVGVVAATATTALGTTVAAKVAPRGSPLTAWFEYGVEATLTNPQRSVASSLPAADDSVLIQAELTSLTPNTPYYVRLVASNAVDTARGALTSFQTLDVPPASPVGLRLDAIAAAGIDLAWTDASSNESEFRVEVSLLGGAWQALATVPAGATAHRHTPVVEARTYGYRVRACNAAGCSAPSGEVYATAASRPVVTTSPASGMAGTSAVLVAEVNPGGLTGTARFEWGRASDLAGAALTDVQTLPAESSTRELRATITELTAGATYYFRVVASNSLGTVRGEIRSFQQSAAVPAAPGNLTGTATGSEVTVTWRDNSATESYFEVQWRVSGESVWSTIAGQLPANSTSFRHTGVSPGTHLYRVRACSLVGCSGWSAEWTINLVRTFMAVTQAATEVIRGTAVLHSWVMPRTGDDEVWFELSPNANLNPRTSLPGDVHYGDEEIGLNIWAVATGLTGGARYYFRGAAASSADTVRGEILSFTAEASPMPPLVTTGPAVAIYYGAVVIQATVDPRGAATTLWVEYGTDPTLAAHDSVGWVQEASGTREIMFNATPGSRIYYRAVARNVDGTVRGAIRSAELAAPRVHARITASLLPDLIVGLSWDTTAAAAANQAVASWRLIARTGGATGTWVPFQAQATQAASAQDYVDVRYDLKEYVAVACNALGCGDETQAPNIAAVSGLRIAPPTELRTVTTSFTRVELAWKDNSNNEPAFRLTRTVPGGATRTWDLPANTTTFTDDTDIPRDVGFLYVVRGLAPGDRLSEPSNDLGVLVTGTPPALPEITTGPVLHISTQNLLTVSADVLANGAVTTVWFEYGPDSTLAYGSARLTTGDATIQQFIYVSQPQVFYRAVAQNALGTVRGAIRSTVWGVPLAAPAVTAGTLQPDYTVSLRWDPTPAHATNQAVTSYRIQGRIPGGNWNQLATIGDLATTQVVVWPLSVTTDVWEFQVIACNGRGCGVGGTPLAVSGLRMPAPTNLTAVRTGPNRVELAWAETSTDEIAFLLLRKPVQAGAANSKSWFTPANATSYVDTEPMVSGVEYYYEVQAQAASGLFVPVRYSAPSNRVTIIGP